MSTKNAKKAFNNSKIILCKRNEHGQFYVAQGFCDMVHFTIGPEGKKQITKYFKDHEIKYHELKGLDTIEQQPPWFRVSSRGPKAKKDVLFLTKIDLYMKNIASVFIPKLIKVSFYWIIY